MLTAEAAAVSCVNCQRHPTNKRRRGHLGGAKPHTSAAAAAAALLPAAPADDPPPDNNRRRPPAAGTLPLFVPIFFFLESSREKLSSS